MSFSLSEAGIVSDGTYCGYGCIYERRTGVSGHVGSYYGYEKNNYGKREALPGYANIVFGLWT